MRYLKEEDKCNKISNLSLISKSKKKRISWILKITTISFLLSLFLSIFSELFLSSSNIFLATVLLIIFMLFNILSDMIGLAIVSCQVEELKKENLDKKLFNKCLKLIKNSDKVSTILCDVIGDACGILCGVSGSILSIIISKKIIFGSFSGVLAGAIISSLIVGLTVLFKAISKKYAIINSVKIVKRVGGIMFKFERK